MAYPGSLIVAAAAAALLLNVDGAAAAPVMTNDTAQSTDLSAQRRQRPRTRIRIYAPYSYPGPHAVRHCTSWLEPEWRPSGTVIVPRMRCWWVPG
jgi:hypothetical protein